MSTDQDLSLHSTKTIDQPYLEPPPPPYTESSQQKSGLVVLARNLTIRKPLRVPITVRTRIFYIVTGTFFMIWAAATIGLEISLMMHAYSTFYQGLWVSGVLIGVGTCTFIIACQKTHYVMYVLYLFVFVGAAIALGTMLSFLDTHVKNPCLDDLHPVFCETKLGNILRWSLAAELTLAMFHCTVSTICVSLIKSSYKSIPPPVRDTQTININRR